MVFPGNHSQKNAFAGSLENIAVAWIFSRPSTRAMADAMPLLEAGKTVQIFTVVDDKPLHSAHPGSALAKYLATHGVEANFEEIKSNGRSNWRRVRHICFLARMPTWVLFSH